MFNIYSSDTYMMYVALLVSIKLIVDSIIPV